MLTKILSFYAFGDNRIEIKLSNGQALTLQVNPDTGKVRVLSDAPHVIGNQALDRDSGLPCNIVPVEYYGYPQD